MSENTVAANAEKNDCKNNVDEETENSKHSSKYIIWRVVLIVILVVTIVIMVSFLFFRYMSGSLKVYDYMTKPVFVGYDGYASVSFNKEDDKSSETKFVNYMTKYAAGDLKFKEEYKEAGNQWLKDHEYPTLMDLVLSYLMTDYSVDILSAETGVIDRKPVVVRWYGTYSMEADNYNNLSNGDVITLKWTFNGKEDEFRKLEACIETEIDTSDIELIVSGLEKTPYIMSPSELDDEYIAELCDYCYGTFSEYINSEWNQQEKVLNSYNYDGYMLATNMDLSTNILFLSFKGNAVYSLDNNSQNVDFWVYYKFENVNQLKNGEMYANTANMISPYYLYSANHGKLQMWITTVGECFNVYFGNYSRECVGYKTEYEMWEDQLSDYTESCVFWYGPNNGSIEYLDFR